MKVIVIYNEKYKKLYIIDSYKYNFNTFLNNNIQRWTCTKRIICKLYKYFKLNKNSE